MKSIARILLLSLFLMGSPLVAETTPNVVLIYADDLGYGDLGSYGHPVIHTPHLDKLASQGMRFTDFYVAQAVCSASRTALLTGCYPNRVGIQGALGPKNTHGIADGETTLAEIFKSKGYATAIFGKWHLGHHPQFLPTRHGFDEYYGLPYSNDMWPYFPGGKNIFPELPLIEQDKVVNPNVQPSDQKLLTTQYTERAVSFIERNKDNPFFLYLPHAMPHVPLFTHDDRTGRSRAGTYGDVIEEIDWSVGQVLGALEKHGLEENTLVIFTSDNGPWLSYGDHAGSAGPLREGKATAWDGGVRVPCLMRWPGKIPAAGVCREPVMTIDILPTLAGLLNAPLPQHKIDGRDIAALMMGRPGAKSPHEALFFYWGSELHAVRSGPWSLHFPHKYPSLTAKGGGMGGKPAPYEARETPLALFNLNTDIGQTRNLAEHRTEIVQRLTALADAMRNDLGDSLTGKKPTGARPPGQLK